LLSVTSELGAFPGAAVASTSNLGRLFPLHQGDLDSDAEDLDYLIQSGGALQGATWTWKRDADAATEFFGRDDTRHWWGHHAPFHGATGSENLAGGWLSKLRRIVLININDTTDSMGIRYRDEGDRYDDWTNPGSFALTGDGVADGHHNCAMVGLPDGQLLLAVRTEGTTTGPDEDIDIYHTADGITWTLVSPRIVENYDGSPPTFNLNNNIRIGRSGEFIRLCAVEDTTDVLLTWLSRDRGITWERLTDDVAFFDSGDTDEPMPFSLTGITDGGDFILVHPRTTNELVGFRAAHQDEDWRDLLFTTATSPTNQGVNVAAIWRGPGFIYHLQHNGDVENKDQQSISWRRTTADLALLAPSDETWQQQFVPFKWDGQTFTPARTHVFWAGDRHVWFGGFKSSTSRADTGISGLFYIGGWSERSLGRIGPGVSWNTYLFDQLWTKAWSCHQGKPAAPTGSDWAEALAGGGSTVVSANRYQLTTTANGDQIRVDWNRAAASGEGWGHALDQPATFRWVMSLDSGDSSIATDDVAVIISSANTLGTLLWDVSVRITGSTVRLYDNRALNTLEDLTGLSIDNGEFGPYTEFRLTALASAGVPTIQLAVRELDDELNPGAWVVSSTHAPQVDATAGAALFRFGHPNHNQGATQMRSYWREVNIAEGNAEGQGMTQKEFTFVNPTDLLGEVASPDVETYVVDGMALTWAGVSGIAGDSFDGLIEHVHNVGNIVVDSPRIDWRSTSQAAQTMIFDADPTNGLKRWQHSAIALYGTNSRFISIDYDNDSAFGSPTGAAIIDATLWDTGTTPLVVETVAAGTVIFDITSASLNGRFTTGQLVGKYVRVLTGSATGATWKITKHDSLREIWVEDETVAVNTQGLAATDTIAIFGDRAINDSIVSGLQRYMRLRFTETDTAEGDHRLGTMVVGQKYDFDVPIDWAFTDNEQPNVTKYGTKSAVQWAYEEGPPQRTVIGRIVGDANRKRRELRELLRAVGYEARPIALVIDEDNANEGTILGRVVSGGQLDHAGWRLDANNGLAYAVGDMSIQFVEEV
jgi:hypothetical protein